MVSLTFQANMPNLCSHRRVSSVRCSFESFGLRHLLIKPFHWLRLTSDWSPRWAAGVWFSMELPWCCCWDLWVNLVPYLPLCLILSWERSSAPFLVWSRQSDSPTCSLLTSTPPGTSLFWVSLSSSVWCCQATSNRTRWSPVSATAHVRWSFSPRAN